MPIASGGLITGGAGAPVAGSESGGFGTGGGADPDNSTKVLFGVLPPALVAPTVLFMPFGDTVAEPLAVPAVVTLTRPPSALEIATLADALDGWAEVIDAVASSSSVDRLAASPQNEPCKHGALSSAK